MDSDDGELCECIVALTLLISSESAIDLVPSAPIWLAYRFKMVSV